MTDIKFRSDLQVQYVDHSGGDRRIARSAWVLPPEQKDDRDNQEGHRRVIRSMLLASPPHTGPFEHGDLGVYLEVPAVVWWQLTRHRFMSQEVDDLSFNLESGRYKILEGQFYQPPVERPCMESEGFRPMRPNLSDSNYCLNVARDGIETAVQECWTQYKLMLARGVAREVARDVLPFSIYYAGMISAKPWTWLHFLSLRLKGGGGYPQWEISEVARQCAAIFTQHWPITWELFQERKAS